MASEWEPGVYRRDPCAHDGQKPLARFNRHRHPLHAEFILDGVSNHWRSISAITGRSNMAKSKKGKASKEESQQGGEKAREEEERAQTECRVHETDEPEPSARGGDRRQCPAAH